MLRSDRIGQELSITTIVIALLAIIVIAILVTMFIQKTNVFSKESAELTEQSCLPGNTVCPIGTSCELILGKFSDVPAGKVCCKGSINC